MQHANLRNNRETRLHNFYFTAQKKEQCSRLLLYAFNKRHHAGRLLISSWFNAAGFQASAAACLLPLLDAFLQTATLKKKSLINWDIMRHPLPRLQSVLKLAKIVSFLMKYRSFAKNRLMSFTIYIFDFDDFGQFFYGENTWKSDFFKVTFRKIARFAR